MMDPRGRRRLNRKCRWTPSRQPSAAWRAIDQANRIFGPDGWSREVVELRNPANREREGVFSAAYVAKVRVTLRIETGEVAREGYGCGEGRGATPFDAHDHGLKAAELDATLRTLASFGAGLGLHAFTDNGDGSPGRKTEPVGPEPAPAADSLNAGAPTPDVVRGTQTAAEEPRDATPGQVDVMLPKLPVARSPEHLRHVRAQPCLICDRRPSDAHHLRFMQPRAMSRKVSDEFTVPLCRRHHQLLHRDPDERAWWSAYGVDPVAIAEALWRESRQSE